MIPTTAARYVIYYGWLIADATGLPGPAAAAIAAAGPELLIGFYDTFEPKYPNFSPPVRDLLHAAQVALVAYIDTDYGNRPLAAVEAEAAGYLARGIDGIFFDQVYNFLDDRHTLYYRRLYELVHRNGKMVIANTGVAQSGAAVMDVTDILMVEHDWRMLRQSCPWRGRYPSRRFMGNSSNEPGSNRYFDYRVDCETAVRDTCEAWASGVGWHYSTDQYTLLPAWFLEYMRRVSKPASSSRSMERLV